MWNLWQSWKLNLGDPSSGLKLPTPRRMWHLLYLRWDRTPWGLQSGSLLEGGPVPRLARLTASFFQSGSDRGDVCMASVQRPAWLFVESILLCVQPEASLLATFPSSHLAKDDKTYQLFHRLTLDGQNQTCSLGAKNTFSRYLENRTVYFKEGRLFQISLLS